MALVLGADVAVSATTVEVRDADTGALVATARSPHPPLAAPGREVDPARWWSALLDARARTGQRELAALAVAGLDGVVVCDEAGAVLVPARTWQSRTAVPEADALVAQFGAERWARTVGRLPGPGSAVAVLAHLVHHRDAAARIGRLVHPADWLTWRLTGRWGADRATAAASGCWSPAQGRWRPDVLARIDDGRDEEAWAGALPTVRSPGARADWLAAPVHDATGLRGRPLVAVGTGRRAAAALALGLVPGDLLVVVAGHATCSVVTTAPTADASGRVRCEADAAGALLPTVATSEAGRLLGTLSRVTGTAPVELAELARRTSDSGSVRVRPAPGGPAGSSGEAAVAGLGRDATPAMLARAALEGVADGVLDGIDDIAGAIGPDAHGPAADRPLHLLAPAGSASAWAAVLADRSGRAVVVPELAEPVATGACVQAAAALAGVSPLEVARAWRSGRGRVTGPPVGRG